VIALMDIPPRYYKCHCVTVVYALPLTRYWRVLFDEVGLTMCIKALQAVPLTDAPPCCLKSIDISKSNTATSWATSASREMRYDAPAYCRRAGRHTRAAARRSYGPGPPLRDDEGAA